MSKILIYKCSWHSFNTRTVMTFIDVNHAQVVKHTSRDLSSPAQPPHVPSIHRRLPPLLPRATLFCTSAFPCFPPPPSHPAIRGCGCGALPVWGVPCSSPFCDVQAFRLCDARCLCCVQAVVGWFRVCFAHMGVHNLVAALLWEPYLGLG